MDLNSINSVISIAVQAMNAARMIRDAMRAGNPTAPDGSFPTDQELIQRFLTEAKLLDAEATALREWLKTLPQQ